MRSKGKKIIKNNKKVEAVFKESHVMALLKDMRDSIKLIAETQSATIKELREFKIETRDNFKAVFEYQSRFSDEVDKRFDEADERFNKLDDELAEIKEELKKVNKNKISVKKFNLLEKRVIKLERKLQKYKVSIRARV